MKYAVIIDAGSSGSRSFVYSWPNPETYLDGVHGESVLRSALLPIETMQNWVHKIHPGISSFAGDTKHIWKRHLKDLLKNAKEIVPAHQIPETPVYFLATAGMRLLPENDRLEILNEVCHALQHKTRFLVPECESHVAMIDGQTEGLYGWLGLNYLIHWSLSNQWDDFENTYGFLDMGGASAQVAYATKNIDSSDPHMHSLRIRTASGVPVEWDVYVTTWLGHGANQAYNRLKQQIISEIGADEVQNYVNEGVPVPAIDPCLPAGAMDIQTFQDIKYVFQGSGDFQKCERMSTKLLSTHECAEDVPCLFNEDLTHFAHDDMKFVGVSEFWYTFEDLFHINGKFDYQNLEPKVREFCSSEWTDITDRLANNEFLKGKNTPFTELEIKQACFKASWVLSVLRRGLNFPLVNTEQNSLTHDFKDQFQSASDIYGTEISWTLGRAVLYASAQIPPANEAARTEGVVGYYTGDGTFYNGGEIKSETELKLLINKNLPSEDGWFYLLIILLLLLTVKFRTKLVKLVQRAYHKLFPSLEQQFASQLNMGYGNTFPHAGIPLQTFDNGVSSSLPSSRTPSRLGFRNYDL